LYIVLPREFKADNLGGASQGVPSVGVSDPTTSTQFLGATLGKKDLILSLFGVCCTVIALIAICAIVFIQFNPAVLKGLVKKKRIITIKTQSHPDIQETASSESSIYETMNRWTIMPRNSKTSHGDDGGDSRVSNDDTQSAADQRSIIGSVDSKNDDLKDQNVRLQIKNQRWLKALDTYAMNYSLKPDVPLEITASISRILAEAGVTLLSPGDKIWYTRGGPGEDDDDDESKTTAATDQKRRARS